MLDNLNPIPKETREGLSKSVDSVNDLFQKLNSAIDWLKNLDSHISELSIKLMTKSFEFLTKFVLQTPSFLFNSD
jgi:hypothetical protein